MERIERLLNLKQFVTKCGDRNILLRMKFLKFEFRT
jgi:hypothetical protein